MHPHSHSISCASTHAHLYMYCATYDCATHNTCIRTHKIPLPNQHHIHNLTYMYIYTYIHISIINPLLGINISRWRHIHTASSSISGWRGGGFCQFQTSRYDDRHIHTASSSSPLLIIRMCSQWNLPSYGHVISSTTTTATLCLLFSLPHATACPAQTTPALSMCVCVCVCV